MGKRQITLRQIRTQWSDIPDNLQRDIRRRAARSRNVARRAVRHWRSRVRFRNVFRRGIVMNALRNWANRRVSYYRSRSALDKVMDRVRRDEL